MDYAYVDHNSHFGMEITVLFVLRLASSISLHYNATHAQLGTTTMAQLAQSLTVHQLTLSISTIEDVYALGTLQNR